MFRRDYIDDRVKAVKPSLDTFNFQSSLLSPQTANPLTAPVTVQIMI